MSNVHVGCTPFNWPADSQKYDIYISEGGIYELVFGSQQPKAKGFRKNCYNTMFQQIRKQRNDGLHTMKIEDLTKRVQVLEFINEEERQNHQ